MSRDIVYMTVISDRKNVQALITELTAFGATLFLTVYGKGIAGYSSFLEAFGLVQRQDKAVITCLIKHDKADAALEMLKAKFKFDKPNTGIAFTVQVESIQY